MEFTNKQNADKDRQAVEDAMVQMSGLAKAVVSDGLNITVKQLWEITTGRLSLTKIYEDEAKGRTSKDPKYAQDNAVSIAKGQANKHQALVDSCRNYPIVGRWKADSYTMDEACNVSFVGDLKTECLKLNTQPLDKKQIVLHDAVKKFRNELEVFNKMLQDAGKQTIVLNIPFVNVQNEIDLPAILTINFELIEEKRKTIQQQIEKDIKAKEAIRLKIENIVPLDFPDRSETVARFINVELTEERPKEFYLNLMFPDKGSFKSKGVTSIGRTYEQ